MRVQVPDLDYKWLDTVVIFERDASCKDDGIVSLAAESAGPELGSLDRRRVDRERLALHIVVGCRLQASHIRAMTQLGLGVATYDVKGVDSRQVMRLLLISAKCRQRIREHGLMECQRVLPRELKAPTEVHLLKLMFTVVQKVMLRTIVLHHDSYPLPPGAEFLLSAHLVVVQARLDLGVISYIVMHFFDVLYKLVTEKVRCHLSLVEVYLGPLLSQIRVHNAAFN